MPPTDTGGQATQPPYIRKVPMMMTPYQSLAVLLLLGIVAGCGDTAVPAVPTALLRQQASGPLPPTLTAEGQETDLEPDCGTPANRQPEVLQSLRLSDGTVVRLFAQRLTARWTGQEGSEQEGTLQERPEYAVWVTFQTGEQQRVVWVHRFTGLETLPSKVMFVGRPFIGQGSGAVAVAYPLMSGISFAQLDATADLDLRTLLELSPRDLLEDQQQRWARAGIVFDPEEPATNWNAAHNFGIFFPPFPLDPIHGPSPMPLTIVALRRHDKAWQLTVEWGSARWVFKQSGKSWRFVKQIPN